MASTREAVKAGQTVLINDGGQTIKADGIWGRRTESAFSSAADSVKAKVENVVSSLGHNLAKIREAALRPIVASKNAALVLEKARSQGITGFSLVNLMATLDAESGFISRKESHKYTPTRARETFSALAGLSDAAISQLVSLGPVAFFETVYGFRTRKGRDLGNVQPGDGGKFLGRGFIQLTGRANYEKFEADSGHKVTENPDLLLDAQIAAEAAIWYWKTRVVKTGRDTTIRSATLAVKGVATDRSQFARKYQALA